MTSRSRTTANRHQQDVSLKKGAAKTKTPKKKLKPKLPQKFKKPIYVQSLGVWPVLTPDEVALQIYQQAEEKLHALIKH